MKTLFAAALSAAALLLAPAGHADVVVGPGVVVGSDVQVGPGITDPEPAALVVPVADPFDSAAQAAAGRPPCLSADGVPYYTPGDSPCG
jgi:hypothetical protein